MLLLFRGDIGVDVDAILFDDNRGDKSKTENPFLKKFTKRDSIALLVKVHEDLLADALSNLGDATLLP